MVKTETLDTEAKLRERVKELTCLYQVVQLATSQSDAPLKDMLQSIAELVPSGWQYSDITVVRISLDDQVCITRGFKKTPYSQTADIFYKGKSRGSIDVYYLEPRPTLYEGPFLQEERNLLDALARELSSIFEQYQTKLQKAELEEQLRHADRLATLGQLAAGVAHELNEPLGNILGFAQLAQKTPDTPVSVLRDLEKIVDACLHSRKIISKLKYFARKMPSQQKQTDINDIIQERLLFIESRCAKNGINIERQLLSPLPMIFADTSQLHQVLINLMVNAVQSMPDGGTLFIQTSADSSHVKLTISDTGEGIAPEVLDKIFLPFFSTKCSDQGTGLGLSVVDEIVKNHGGEIVTRSTPGEGTTFEVIFPIYKG